MYNVMDWGTQLAQLYLKEQKFIYHQFQQCNMYNHRD